MSKYLIKNSKVNIDGKKMARLLSLFLAFAFIITMVSSVGGLFGSDDTHVITGSSNFCENCCVVTWHGDSDAPDFGVASNSGFVMPMGRPTLQNVLARTPGSTIVPSLTQHNWASLNIPNGGLPFPGPIVGTNPLVVAPPFVAPPVNPGLPNNAGVAARTAPTGNFYVWGQWVAEGRPALAGETTANAPLNGITTQDQLRHALIAPIDELNRPHRPRGVEPCAVPCGDNDCVGCNTWVRVINVAGNFDITGEGNIGNTPYPVAVGTGTGATRIGTLQVAEGRNVWVRSNTVGTVRTINRPGTNPATSRQMHFRVVGGSTLTISDITLARAGTTNRGGGVWVWNYGTFNMQARSTLTNNGGLLGTVSVAEVGVAGTIIGDRGGGVLVHGTDAVFNMNGGRITGGNNSTNGGSAVYISSTGTFNWNNGTIEDNNLQQHMNGVVRIRNGAQVFMHGGFVRSNAAGTGILVEGADTRLTLTGGVQIHHNTNSGHGLHIRDGAQVIMAGGGALRNNGGNGARVEGAGSSLRTIGNVAIHTNSGNSGVYVFGGASVISDSVSIDGVRMSGAGSTFNSNAPTLRLTGNSGAGNHGLYVSNGESIILTNVTIDNNGGTGIHATGGTTVTMNGGSINDNGGGGFNLGSGTAGNRTTISVSYVEIAGNSNSNSGVSMTNSYTEFIMGTGTLIRNHGTRATTTIARGGGVEVSGANNIFRMNGGQIRNNHAQRGGGIYVAGNNRVYMNGGVIGGEHGLMPNDSRVGTVGGGGSGSTDWINTVQNLLIHGNRSVDEGGGVRVGAGGTFIMNRDIPTGAIPGAIIGNYNATGNSGFSTSTPVVNNDTDPWSAGGVAVFGLDATFRMYDGVIRGNWAGRNAGGVLVRLFPMAIFDENRTNTAGANARTAILAAYDALALANPARRPSFHLIGGSIEYNRSSANQVDGLGGGGGVAVSRHSNFYMGRNNDPYLGGNSQINAYIHGNFAQTTAGGVRMRDASRFFMFNGAIINNNGGGGATGTNRTGGGGVFLEQNDGGTGGGVNLPSSFVIYGGTVSNNISRDTRNIDASGGGGFMINYGDLHFRGSDNKYIEGNTSHSHGGGIQWSGNAFIHTDGREIRTTNANTANTAGTHPVNTGTVSLSHNRAALNGGGIRVLGTGFESRYFVIDHNWAGRDGGGVFAASSIAIWGGSVSYNFAGRELNGNYYMGANSRRGGGIFIHHSPSPQNINRLDVHRSTRDVYERTLINYNSAGLSGGGIHAGNTVVLNMTHTEVSYNYIRDLGDGGGVFNPTDGTITAFYSYFNGNEGASRGGGIFTLGGTINLTDSTVGIAGFGNLSSHNGGGIFITGGTLNITRTTIDHNISGRYGGGMFIGGGTVNLTASHIGTLEGGNLAYESGGGIFMGAATSIININGTANSISGNTANSTSQFGGGGGIFMLGAAGMVGNYPTANFETGVTAGRPVLNMAGGIMDGNTAHRGGAVFVVGGRRSNNSAAPGAEGTPAFLASNQHSHGAQFNFNGGTISNNHAHLDGGAIFLQGGHRAGGSLRTATGTTAAGNDRGRAHGGEFNMGVGTVIEGNSANRGGGVFVDRGHSSNNTATGRNAAVPNILLAYGARLTVNGTIRNNHAYTVGGGVFLHGLTPGQDNYNTIHLDAGARLTLSATGVIDGNTARYSGGGVAVLSRISRFTMNGGIIRNNQAGYIRVIDDNDNSNDTNGAIAPLFTHGGGGAYFGGGVFVDGLGPLFTMTTGQVYGNYASHGGGIAVIGGGTAAIQGGTIGRARPTGLAIDQPNPQGNSASCSGGGIFVGANSTANVGTATSRAYVVGNNAERGGGGIVAIGAGATLTVNMTRIDGNQANYGGGIAVVNSATATINNSTIGRMPMVVTGDDYGAVDARPYIGFASQEGHHATGNTAFRAGGGIYANSGGTVNIGNILPNGVWIVGNNALNGGGIFVSVDEAHRAGTVNLTRGSIWHNRALRFDIPAPIVCDCDNCDECDDCQDCAYCEDDSVAVLGNGGGVMVYGDGNFNIMPLAPTPAVPTPTIRIRYNLAEGYGGGMAYVARVGPFDAQFVRPDIPNIQRLDLIQNRAANGGGIASTGVYGGSLVQLRNTIISQNTASISGGGVYHYSSSALEVTTNVTITHNNATTGNGGGIAKYGRGNFPQFLIYTANISNNNAPQGDGGGIYANGLSSVRTSALNAQQLTINQNSAINGGGIAIRDSGLFMGVITISNNQATGNGGGICIYDSYIEICSGSVITGNSATYDGGGININNSGGGIGGDGGSWIGGIGNANRNTANFGGGISVSGDSGVLLAGSIDFLRNNYAVNGGGLGVREGSEVWHSSGDIVENTASGNGGGFFVESGATLSLNLIAHGVMSNTAINGAGGYVAGTLTVWGDRDGSFGIMDNTATNGYGGGVFVNGNGATATFTNTSIHANEANRVGTAPGRGNGGGIAVSAGASATVNNVAIYGNMTSVAGDGAGNVAGNGGGVWTAGAFTMNANTNIVDNTATNYGGGIYVTLTGTVTANGTGSTISGNSAGLDGGGVFTECHSYANPANPARYSNIHLLGVTFGYGANANVAGRGSYERPDNYNDFYTRLYNRFNGLLLNNNNINFRRLSESVFVSKLVLEADWLGGPPTVSANTDSEFIFTVTFRNAIGGYLANGIIFDVVGGTLSDVPGATAPNITQLPALVNGTTTFTLRNGQSIYILNAPVGGSVEITENIPVDAALYTTTVTMLNRVGNAYVPYVRTGMTTGQREIRQVAADAARTTNSFEWTNLRAEPYTPPTGVNVGGGNVWTVVVLAVLAVTGVVTMAFVQAKKNERTR